MMPPLHDVRCALHLLATGPYSGRRFQAELNVRFALAALVLTPLGLYGLTRYAVEQRKREIGIRVALGATRGDVPPLVLR